LDYVLGLCINNGKKLFGVKWIEGKIDELDKRIEENRLVLEICMGWKIEDKRVKNNDFELLKVD
jgi:hypothetical protein